MKSILQTTIALTALFVLFAQTAPVQAQGFDVEGYLKRLDRNNNGVLEPDEMSGRTRGFIERLGFDPDNRIRVRDVVAKVNRAREEREEQREREERGDLKIPPFGTEASEEKSEISRFGVSTESSSGSRFSRTADVPDRIKEQVDQAMERYDSNKDGILDRREIERGRWGSPNPMEHDANRDGNLSRNELIQRYEAREEARRDDRDDRRDRGDRGDDRRSRGDSDDRSSAAARREAFRQSGSSGSSSSSRSFSSRSRGSSSRPSSSSSRSSTSSSGSSVDRAKYEKYAESLIKQYDENKSGSLEKDEISKMRRPPQADANKDGTITKDELIDSLTGKTSSSSSSDSKSSSSGEDRESRSGSRFGSRSRGGSSRGSSSSFEELDVNKDRRIHMYEFGRDWNEDLVEQFKAKDKNGDGIITYREWSSGE